MRRYCHWICSAWRSAKSDTRSPISKRPITTSLLLGRLVGGDEPILVGVFERGWNELVDHSCRPSPRIALAYRIPRVTGVPKKAMLLARLALASRSPVERVVGRDAVSRLYGEDVTEDQA